MDLRFEERPSDSPFVESVWRSQGEREGSFISMAETQYGLVVTEYRGTKFLTVRGPSTSAAPAYTPQDTQFIGIQFKTGVSLSILPPARVMDRHDLSLPEAASQSFWLHGSAWQYPDYENADTFVNRLVQDGLLACDPIVETVLQARPVDMSIRNVRRRFLRATGLTHGAIHQIDRARYATALLKQGVSVLDTAFQAGYSDQPHLTHSLKRYIGLTPAQIQDQNRTERLSFLYKTASL